MSTGRRDACRAGPARSLLPLVRLVQRSGRQQLAAPGDQDAASRTRTQQLDVATLTELLREAEEHHGEYEATAPKHHWSEWYAAYIVAREQGRTPEEAAKDGALHMESCPPMRADIVPGAVFPDYELSDHRGTHRTLSELQGGDPLVLVLSRGGFCPKDRRQHEGLLQLHREMQVGYCRLVTISTDNLLETNEFRAGVGAHWTFLSDPGRKVQKDLDIAEYTDPHHNPMIPHTLVLEPGLRVYKIYNGYWFFGRPTVEELRLDLRAVLQRCRPDWDISSAEQRTAWAKGEKAGFYPYGKTQAQVFAEQDLDHEPDRSPREPELLGQTVVVIGGSAGIGLETARRARAEGANVILTGRNPERLQRAASELGALSTAAFDAADPAALEQFFRDLPAPIDHVMVTAGAAALRAPARHGLRSRRASAIGEHLLLAL